MSCFPPSWALVGFCLQLSKFYLRCIRRLHYQCFGERHFCLLWPPLKLARSDPWARPLADFLHLVLRNGKKHTLRLAARSKGFWGANWTSRGTGFLFLWYVLKKFSGQNTIWGAQKNRGATALEYLPRGYGPAHAHTFPRFSEASWYLEWP